MKKSKGENRSTLAENMDVSGPSSNPARPEIDPALVELYQRDIEKERQTYPAEARESVKSEPARPLLPWRGVGQFLDSEPPKPELLFYGKGWEVPDKCVTALFAAGATGKTFMGFQLAACMAAGIDFGPFKTKGNTKKVLYLCGEDPIGIIHRRMKAIFEHMPGLTDRRANLTKNLCIDSLVGQDRILIAFDQQKNPATTQAYDWLCRSIEGMNGVDVLVIDPLIKFFGLTENDNAHGAAWIAMLEAISVRFNAGVLFTHHKSKVERDGNIRESTGRGAGSFSDNVRGALSMVKMNAKTAKTYGTPDNWRKMVAVFPTKVNFAEEAESEEWFFRGPGGVLLPHNVIREQRDRLSSELYLLLKDAVTGQLLDEHGEPISCTRDNLTLRGLTKGTGSPAERAIREAMKERGISSLRDDMPRLVLKLETENKIIIDRAEGGRGQNKNRINVVGYDLQPEPPEPRLSDHEKENQPNIPDLAEGGTDEKSSNPKQQDKATKKKPKISDRSRKHD